jgi:integrase
METINRKTSEPLPWLTMQRLVADLIRDKKYQIAMLISCGSFLGLRHSDIVRLHWCDLTESDKLSLVETKTAKLKRVREIAINPEMKRIAKECQQDKTSEALIFANSRQVACSIQYHNSLLAKLKETYDYIDIEHFSTHSNRKCFALRVYNQLGANEHAINVLQKLLKHSSSSITLCYLGLQQTIETDVYNNL